MKIHDINRYNMAKQKLELLEKQTEVLDKISDLVYSNIGLPGFFDLLDLVEEMRVSSYLQKNEYIKIVKDKGKVNE